MADLSALLARWTAVVGDSPDARANGESLLGRWAEPHRRYHDLTHLAAVLDHVDELVRAEPRVGADVDAIRLAAFFHDAVYDPARQDNEVGSAALAREVLDGLDVAQLRIREVVRLVLLTATHDVDPADGDGAVLCDADLAVLAGDPESYAAYAVAVREEYAHVPEPLFRVGRTSILARLLEHDALFRTSAGRAWWEAAARRNVETELVLLRAQTDGAGERDEGPPPGAV